jgi:hypothetical protein
VVIESRKPESCCVDPFSSSLPRGYILSDYQTPAAVVENAPAESVQEQLSEIWRNLQKDQATREFARKRGVDLEELDALRENPFEARSLSEGNRAGIAEAVIVGVAVKITTDAAYAAVKTLWSKVVKPALERRFGDVDDKGNSGD